MLSDIMGISCSFSSQAQIDYNLKRCDLATAGIISGLTPDNEKNLMHPDELEHRLETLESKVSFQEDTIEKLNQTIISHELEMAKMREQIRLLITRLKSVAPSNIASQSEETPPPHY